MKRALLIGINRYPNLPEGNQLHGCVNDVEAVAVLLRDRFGFTDDAVTLLRDEEATQAGIRAAVEALIGATGRDDVVLVHYSGHGSQRSSTDPTEGDGLDETIVPHDSGRRPHPNLEITDKEINGWVRRLNERTANLTFVFDCCHSGTITRDAFGEAGRSVEPDRRTPEEMGLVPAAGASGGGAEGEAGDRGPSGWLPLTGRYVLIAGSLDAELSHEMEAGAEGTVVPHGALSFFLARELAVARPGTTYRDVFERASVAVSSRYRDQHPQMEGDARDREVLGTKVVEVMPFVSVAGRTDGSVTLQGGAAFGLAPGSEWDVYPEGTKEANRTLRLGRVRIDELRALSSRATLLEESAPGAVVPGCRAVEVVHAFGDQRLGIEVRGPAEAAATTKELEADVDASPYLRAASTEAADLRVYLLSPRTGSAEGDPVPQLARIDRASWAVVGRDGRLAMPVHSVDEPGASETVRSNLERIARYRSAVALTNPDPGAILRGKVDLVLQARTPKGDWEDATPTASGGTVVFAEGDRIALRVTNGHTEPVYVSVLDFGLTGRIAQVYPPAGVADRVDPGMGIRVGVDPGAELPLEFPHDFPFVRDPDETAPVEGLETLKLFATTGRPVNFDPLLQEGMRADIGEPEESSPLSRLLSAALRGQGTRDIAAQPLAAPPDEQWITVDRPFVLRRT